MNLRDTLLLLMICFIWGGHFSVVKIAVDGNIAPMFYAAIRMALVSLILLPLLKWHRGKMKAIFLAGLCFGGLNYSFMFSGIYYANASISALIMEVYAPITMILSVLILKEKVGLTRISAMSIAFVGVIIICLGSGTEGTGPNMLLGIVLLICCTIAEAFGAITVKTIKDVRPLELLSWFAVIGTAVLSFNSFIFESNHLMVLEEGRWKLVIPAILYSAIGASILGHATYYGLIQRLPVNQIATSTLLTTLIAVVLSIVILREPITVEFMIGGVLLLGGVGVILFRNNADKEKAESVPAQQRN